MARRSKTPSGSPNTVLVIFLIIFILTTLGFGGWVYAAYNQRDKDAKAWKDKEKEVKELQETRDFYKYQRNELMAAIGTQEASKPGFMKDLKDNREPFLKLERFRAEDDAAEFRDTVKVFLEQKLGGFDDGYRNKFAEIPGPLEDKLRKAKADFAKAKADLHAKEQELLAQEKKYAADRTTAAKSNEAGNDKAFEARKQATEAMTQAINLIGELEKKLGDRETDFSKEIAQKSLDIKLLQEKLKSQESLDQLPNRSGGAVRGLLLDISKAKTLWDSPRGKILRVEDGGKRVFIDKGSKDGVKPGLTFLVFASNWNGRGEGELKAAIEVIRVEDANMSLCKVNTFYDIDGREISVTDATPGKLLREGGGAIKSGDLLFNLFWGAHVAIGGIIDIGGGGSNSPAAQMDALNQFMQHLQRMGITVDAYTDLRDGRVVGEVTNQTNFAIRGANATSPPPPAPPDPRAKAINDNNAMLRDLAAERGMFLISPDNFAVVTGYRRLGGNGSPQTLTFIPTRPGGDVGPAAPTPPGPMPK